MNTIRIGFDRSRVRRWQTFFSRPHLRRAGREVTGQQRNSFVNGACASARAFT
jgi:hypothetical protein